MDVTANHTFIQINSEVYDTLVTEPLMLLITGL